MDLATVFQIRFSYLKEKIGMLKTYLLQIPGDYLLAISISRTFAYFEFNK